MGLIDAILEGIGKVILLFVGIIILLAGFYGIATGSSIIGVIALIIGLGIMVGAKSYSR